MSNARIKPTPHPPPVDYRAVDDGWRQWIAENRLRDCTPESMIAVMMADGLNAHESRVAVTQIEHNPIFLAARRTESKIHVVRVLHQGMDVDRHL